MALAPNTGLHASKPIAPLSDRFALKSSFFSQSLHLLLPPKSLSTALKFSMRVDSKQAYVCRDCGQALPSAIPLGAAALAGLYFYLNSTY